MPHINYIKENRMFLTFSARNQLSANEIILWHALFEMMNQHSVGTLWPDAPVPISNASLLALTCFGQGASAVETLRRARGKLVQRGLLQYTPGKKRIYAPSYLLLYLSLDKEETPGGEHNPPAASAPVLSSGQATGLPLPSKPMLKDDTESFTHSVLDNSLRQTPPVSKRPVYKLHGRKSQGLPTFSSPQAKPREHKAVDKTVDKPVDVSLNLNPNNIEDRSTATTAGGHFSAPGQEVFDEGWKNSFKVRGAVSQRLLNSYPGPIDREDAWLKLCELMEDGISPREILDAYPTRPSLHLVLCKLKAERDTRERIASRKRKGLIMAGLL